MGFCGLNIQRIYPGSWGANCYLLSSAGHAILVDPSADARTLTEQLQKNGLALDAILLTHGHFDHIVSVDKLRDATGAPVCIHEQDAQMLTDAEKNAFFTFFGMHRTYRPADRLLYSGEKILLGDEQIQVIHTPGHSMGSVCYLCNDTFLLTGDTLFEEGIGRCDLFGGSVAELRQSLLRLRGLDQSLPIHPGHGEDAILGHALDTVAYL